MNFCVLGSLFLLTQIFQDVHGLTPLAAGLLLLPGMLPLLTPAIVTAAMRTTPGTPGIASGASNTARQTGGALGVALFAAIAGGVAGAAFTSHATWAIGGSALVFAVAAGYGLQADQRPTLISTNGPGGGVA